MKRFSSICILFVSFLISFIFPLEGAVHDKAPINGASDDVVIILENLTATTFGRWKLGNKAKDKHGPDYLWANTQPEGKNQAFWELSLSKGGKYSVEAWWSQHQVNSEAAIFIIETPLEQNQIKVNQQINGGQWNLLGKFFIPPNSKFFIGLLNKAPPGFVVILDMVRLKRVGSGDESDKVTKKEEILETMDEKALVKDQLQSPPLEGKEETEFVLRDSKVHDIEDNRVILKEGKQPPLLKKEGEQIALRGDDERLRPKEAFQVSIGPSLLKITGEFSLDTELKYNRNLDSSKNKDKVELSPELELNFNLEFPRGIQFFSEVSFADEVTFKKEEKPVNEFKVQLEEAFADIPSFLHKSSTLRLGRQQFHEPRRWLFSEELDSIRFLIDISPISFDFSLSTELDFISYASFQPAKKASIAGYVIVRNEEPIEDENPIWAGLRSFGKIKKKKATIKYWFEGSYVAGKVHPALGSKAIKGFALDLGGTFIFRKQPFKPGFTLGYAFGSGDNNPGDGVDNNFRQTGLQSNKSKFGGVTNFEYYGVMIEPELSNLHIFTSGIGVRPIKKASIDFVYHYYLQHKASSEVRDLGIKTDPTGIDKELGHEIDFIIGYKGIKNTKLRLRSGYFIPGRGFKRKDNAFLGKFDIKFAF